MSTPQERLLDYAKRFVEAQPDGATITLGHVAAFGAQMRDGCQQDFLRVIEQLRNDMKNAERDGADVSAAHIFYLLKATISVGEEYDLLGLPDCWCGKSECVYCGRGFAVPTTDKE